MGGQEPMAPDFPLPLYFQKEILYWVQYLFIYLF